jgi:hypothetical protein
MADRMMVLQQLRELERMDIDGLRARWIALMASPVPKIRAVYLRHRLAYRVQELAYGGDDWVNRRLDELAAHVRKQDARKNKRGIKPIVGTRLVRTYKGFEHQVRVLPTGFEYQGKTYTSLTRIACDITGTWISGPAFFGLAQKRREAA